MSTDFKNVKFTRSRCVFFTLNNPEAPLDWAALQEQGAIYLAYQKEVGEEDHTPHFQGVIRFKEPKTLAALKKLPGLERAHFETVKSYPHAIAYVTKEETRVDGPWTFGEEKKQGARSDLLEIQKKLDSGAPTVQIAQEHFGSYIRYNKGFNAYRRITTKPRDFKTTVILFVGPPGTGKTRTATALAEYIGSVYMAPQPKGSGWYWDDYSGQDVVIVDEMDGNTCAPTFFNSLCDRYPFTVPSHGAAGHQFVSRFLFITSNYLPKFWWKKRTPEQVRQATRRIEVVLPFLRIPQNGIPCQLNGVAHIMTTAGAVPAKKQKL